MGKFLAKSLWQEGGTCLGSVPGSRVILSRERHLSEPQFPICEPGCEPRLSQAESADGVCLSGCLGALEPRSHPCSLRACWHSNQTGLGRHVCLRPGWRSHCLGVRVGEAPPALAQGQSHRPWTFTLMAPWGPPPFPLHCAHAAPPPPGSQQSCTCFQVFCGPWSPQDKGPALCAGPPLGILGPDAVPSGFCVLLPRRPRPRLPLCKVPPRPPFPSIKQVQHQTGSLETGPLQCPHC